MAYLPNYLYLPRHIAAAGLSFDYPTKYLLIQAIPSSVWHNNVISVTIGPRNKINSS